MKDQNLAIVFGEEELVRSQNILSNGVRAEEPGSALYEQNELKLPGVDLLNSKVVSLVP
jgi:hypothetical protein